MESVKNLDLIVIIVFILGAMVGITGFSRLLSYTLHNYYDVTVAVLAGFMLGSLNKVWPWKEAAGTFIDSHGIVKPLAEVNIWPNIFVWEGIGLAVAGFALVYFLDRLSNRGGEEKA